MDHKWTYDFRDRIGTERVREFAIAIACGESRQHAAFKCACAICRPVSHSSIEN